MHFDLGHFIMLILSLSGATLIFTRSSIFFAVRQRFEGFPKLHDLVRCPQCSGFWFGAVGGVVYTIITPPLFFASLWDYVVFLLVIGTYALSVSLISYAVDGARVGSQSTVGPPKVTP